MNVFEPQNFSQIFGPTEKPVHPGYYPTVLEAGSVGFVQDPSWPWSKIPAPPDNLKAFHAQAIRCYRGADPGRGIGWMHWNGERWNTDALTQSRFWFGLNYNPEGDKVE